MKKKLIRVLALALSLMMVLTACGTSKKEDTSSAKSKADSSAPAKTDAEEKETPEADKYAEKVTITVARRGGVREVQEDLYSPMIEEKFNAILEVTDINNDDYVTRMNLLFASGEELDVTTSSRPDFMLNEWTEAGYFRGHTKEEVEALLPNYVASYAPEDWEVVWRNIRHSDDKAYYLPGRRASKANMAWMYRKDLFDEYDLEFPESTDELIEVLKVLRDETGKMPIVAANTGVPHWAFTGYLQAFGIPELIPRDLSYVDPRTNEFIPYAFTTDVYRDHIKFMNTLYKENLMWKEFTTGTSDQANKLMSQGNSMVLWGYPEKVDTEYNELSQNENPNASWEWARNMLSSDPDNGFFFKRDPFFAADGASFSTDADDAVIERFIDILNWAYSEEGQITQTYGFEDVTYTKEGDDYVFMEHMMSPTKTDGRSVTSYGVIGLSCQHPNLNAYYRPYITELEDTFIGRDNYYFHQTPIMSFLDEETSQLADIQTNLNQTRDEYYVKFIMGHMDINDDAEWEDYIRTLEKLDLKTFEEIRTKAYERENG